MRFITFADGNFGIRSAAKRLARQAKDSGWFEGGTENWNLETLRKRSPSFFKDHVDFLLRNPAGLGYWLWQPAILYQVMTEAKAGEIICMLDAGCQLNINSTSAVRFEDYAKLAHDHGAVFMQIKKGSFGISDLSEFAWTRKFVIDRFPAIEKDLLEPQIQSGIIIIEVNAGTTDFIKAWLNQSIQEQYFNILPSPKNEINSPNFVAHRHTQSVLSLMVKNSSYSRIPDETYFAPNWKSGLAFPIWAMRNRSGGDAYRREIQDKVKLGLAKFDRKYLKNLHHWKLANSVRKLR
jgi:hypothetical protein